MVCNYVNDGYHMLWLLLSVDLNLLETLDHLSSPEELTTPITLSRCTDVVLAAHASEICMLLYPINCSVNTTKDMKPYTRKFSIGC